MKSCFLDGLGDEANYKARHLVNHLGVDRRLAKPTKRQKQIFLAGRMVPEKGFLEACQAALPVLQSHSDWQICLAGGKDFTTQTLSSYEKRIRDILAPLGAQATILGHQPLAEVRRLQAQSEICIVPSLWQEPGGLTVLEALAAGTALITTNKGGIPEFATGRALIISPDSIADFTTAISTLISSTSQRQTWQQRARDDFPFTAQAMCKRAVQYRAQLLSRNKK